MVVIFKKRNKKDIKNYRQMRLFKILQNTHENTNEKIKRRHSTKNQPLEKAGFRDTDSRRRYHDTVLSCTLKRRRHTAWKTINMVIIFTKGNKKDLKNYRPICLLSNIYKVLRNVRTKRQEKTLDENQPPREEAGFRSRY